MDRREFLSWTGAGWLAVSLPVAIAACSSEASNTADSSAESASSAPASTATDTAPTEVASTDGFIDIQQTVTTLDSEGAVGSTDLAVVPEKVIVVRDPGDSSALLALTSNCNHNDCTVDWSADNGTFVCPCHRSEFSTDGSIVRGPATEPLRVLEARVGTDDTGNEVIEVKF